MAALSHSLQNSVDPKFKYLYDRTASSCDSFPVVDFSALSAADPDQRSKAVHDLSKACEEWGFFILVNHGVPEELMNGTFSAVKEFMSMGDEEKQKYTPKDHSDPLQYVGIDMKDGPKQTFTFWKEKLRFEVHPKFHCLDKPQSLREVVLEYSESSRKVCRKLLEAISDHWTPWSKIPASVTVSDGLQLEHPYVDRVLGLDSSQQLFVGNHYPVCPHPDQVIGLMPHTDYGLLTLLIHNGVPGLQIEHDGRWFKVDSPKNHAFVIVGDQLEIFSNGRYKSVNHRAVVNEERGRMSIVWQYGPSKEAIIAPAAPLVEKDGRAKYRSIKYQEFVERLIKNVERVSSYIQ